MIEKPTLLEDVKFEKPALLEDVKVHQLNKRRGRECPEWCGHCEHHDNNGGEQSRASRMVSDMKRWCQQEVLQPSEQMAMAMEVAAAEAKMEESEDGSNSSNN